jgi:hypothetical protein
MYSIALLADPHVFTPGELPHHVTIPESKLLEAIKASLKMKRGVLVLQIPLQQIPAVDPKQRWQLNEAWFFVAPRALSLLSESCLPEAANCEEIKTYLSKS